MSIQIHRKGLDSLVIGIFPKDKDKYHTFISDTIIPKFKSKKSSAMEIFGFDVYGNYGPSRRSEYPIQLIGHDSIELCFTKTYPQRMAPIQLKLTQPYIWKDPILRAEKIIDQLEEYVGMTLHKVDRADISVHFSGWVPGNENFFNRIISDVKPEKKGQENIEWIRVGSLKGELPQMLVYNKSKDLRKHRKLGFGPVS